MTRRFVSGRGLSPSFGRDHSIRKGCTAPAKSLQRIPADAERYGKVCGGRHEEQHRFRGLSVAPLSGLLASLSFERENWRQNAEARRVAHLRIQASGANRVANEAIDLTRSEIIDTAPQEELLPIISMTSSRSLGLSQFPDCSQCVSVFCIKRLKSQSTSRVHLLLLLAAILGSRVDPVILVVDKVEPEAQRARETSRISKRCHARTSLLR